MARSHFRYTVTDRAGNAIQNSTVTLYLTGTSTLVTDLYTTAVGGSPVVSASLVSNAQGEVEGWLSTPKTVDVQVADTSHSAYYSGAVGTLLTWSPFIETVEVTPPPENVALLDGTQGWTGINTFGTNPVFNDAAIPEAKVASLVSDLAARVQPNMGTSSAVPSQTKAPSLDITSFGAVPGTTSATDILPALNAAIAALPTDSGGPFGEIVIPLSLTGFYLSAAPTALNRANGVTIRGYGAPTGGAGLASLINYHGTDARVFDFRSSAGCTPKAVGLVAVNGAFNGVLFDWSHDGGTPRDSSFVGTEDCYLSAGALGTIANIDNVTSAAFVNTNFAGYLNGIVGTASTANVLIDETCRFGGGAPGGYDVQITSCQKLRVNSWHENKTDGTLKCVLAAGNDLDIDIWAGDASAGSGPLVEIGASSFSVHVGGFLTGYYTVVGPAGNTAVKLGANCGSVDLDFFANGCVYAVEYGANVRQVRRAYKWGTTGFPAAQENGSPAAPTVGALSGSTALSIVGTDRGGQITLTYAAGLTAGKQVVQVTFAQAIPSPNTAAGTLAGAVTLTPRGPANAACPAVTAGLFVSDPGTDNAGFAVALNSPAAGATTIQFDYVVNY